MDTTNIVDRQLPARSTSPIHGLVDRQLRARFTVPGLVAFLFAALLWQPLAHADLDDIRRTAEAGDRNAQLELGILFQYGFNYKDNEIPALTWYSLAANQGHPRAVRLRDSLKAKIFDAKSDMFRR